MPFGSSKTRVKIFFKTAEVLDKQSIGVFTTPSFSMHEWGWKNFKLDQLCLMAQLIF